MPPAGGRMIPSDADIAARCRLPGQPGAIIARFDEIERHIPGGCRFFRLVPVCWTPCSVVGMLQAPSIALGPARPLAACLLFFRGQRGTTTSHFRSSSGSSRRKRQFLQCTSSPTPPALGAGHHNVCWARVTPDVGETPLLRCCPFPDAAAVWQQVLHVPTRRRKPRPGARAVSSLATRITAVFLGPGARTHHRRWLTMWPGFALLLVGAKLLQPSDRSSTFFQRRFRGLVAAAGLLGSNRVIVQVVQQLLTVSTGESSAAPSHTAQPSRNSRAGATGPRFQAFAQRQFVDCLEQ